MLFYYIIRGSDILNKDNSIKIKKGFKPLAFLSKEEVVAYKNGIMGILNINSGKMSNKCRIPMSFSLSLVSKVRIFERLFRLAPHAVELIDGSACVFAFRGNVYKYDYHIKTIQEEYSFPDGMNSPLYFTRIVGSDTFLDGIYCGQYSSNLEKESVKIWRRSLKDNDWKEVYEFPKGQIHHIHNIIPDKNKEFLYILTGDDDAASGIWRAYDNFRVVEPLLIGSQDYRTCVLFELKDKVVYCTDTPMKQNYITQCKCYEGELKIEKRLKIPGTVIYGDINEEEIIFSTVVEPNSLFEECGRLKMYFESKIGDGIKDRNVYIYKGNFETGFEEIYRIQKDIFPMRLFQFGNAQFTKYAFSKFKLVSAMFQATKNDNEWIMMENSKNV